MPTTDPQATGQRNALLAARGDAALAARLEFFYTSVAEEDAAEDDGVPCPLCGYEMAVDPAINDGRPHCRIRKCADSWQWYACEPCRSGDCDGRHP